MNYYCRLLHRKTCTRHFIYTKHQCELSGDRPHGRARNRMLVLSVMYYSIVLFLVVGTTGTLYQGFDGKITHLFNAQITKLFILLYGITSFLYGSSVTQLICSFILLPYVNNFQSFQSYFFKLTHPADKCFFPPKPLMYTKKILSIIKSLSSL